MKIYLKFLSIYFYNFIKIILAAITFCSYFVSAQNGQQTKFLQKVWEAGLPNVTIYSSDDYKAHIQNWCVTQNDNGIIYVGNTSGVLEFDGVSWQLITLSNESPAKSLAKSKDNIIYVGGVSDFGCLVPDSIGQMKFKSLLSLLDSTYHNFADIWFTLAARDAVYFISDNYIFKLVNNSFKIWKTDRLFGFAGLINDRIYIQNKDIGIMQLKDDSLQLISDGEKFLKGITAFVPYEKNKILLSHFLNGLFLYDNNTIVPFESNGAKLLGDKRIYGGTVLPNGDFMFITLGNGCYIVDKKGEIKLHLNKNNSLSSDVVTGIFIDKGGAAWLATENGINRVEISSALRTFAQHSGLNEPVDKMIFYNNHFYAASINGLFYLDIDLNEEIPVNVFKKREDINGQIWDLMSKGDKLFIGNVNGLYELNSKSAIKLLLSENTHNVISSSIDSNLIFAGTTDGKLYTLKSINNSYEISSTFLSIQTRILSIAENTDGSLWVTTRYNGVYKVDWTSHDRSFEKDFTITHFDTIQGLPNLNYNLAVRLKDSVLFSTKEGIYRFDSRKKRFIPDNLISSKIEKLTTSYNDVIKPSFEGGLWIITKSDFKNIFYKLTEDQLIEIEYLKRFFNFDIYDIYDQDSITFFSGSKGIIAINKELNKIRINYQVNLRKVITNDSLIFAGNLLGDNSENISLPFSNNSIRFIYAMPSYDSPDENLYQYFLEGYDKKWSEWSNETQHYYTNLFEGDYIFHIRGKNIYGQISSESLYSFTVLPPLYRTWWAYLFYGLFFIAITWMIVQLRSKQLKREKEKLEDIVKERTLQLEEQTEKLEKLDEQKRRFFANISHEFRTPLTLIKGPIEKTIETKESLTKEEIEMINRNASRLHRLVNQLLDLSRIDANTLKLSTQYGNLYKFIRIVSSAFSSYAEQRKINFLINIPTEDFLIMFDHDKLEKIVYNLLSNALKFTPEHGEISIKVSFSQNEHLVIEVRDNGIGILPEHQHFIFDRFFQSDDSLTRNHEGTGIGLSLTKELVTLLGGNINVQSERNKGTTFTVILPIHKEDFTPDDSSLVSSSGERIDYDFESKSLVENVNTDIKGEEKPIVLIVEDNLDMRGFIKDQLESNYRTLDASDGIEGLEKAKKEIPDLIITDLMMPMMDGFTLCDKLKSNEHTNHIPIIMLTAKTGQQNRIEGLETGADDYLIKPFDRKELLARVSNLIQQRELLRKKYSREILLQPRNIKITSMDENFLSKVENVIEENLSDENFGLPEMQNAMAMSKTQLHRKIKALTDQSPGEYLRNYRLKRAAQILAQQGNTVTQAAYSVGFNNLSYFAKCFKELFGVTPSDYKKEVPD